MAIEADHANTAGVSSSDSYMLHPKAERKLMGSGHSPI